MLAMMVAIFMVVDSFARKPRWDGGWRGEDY